MKPKNQLKKGQREALARELVAEARGKGWALREDAKQWVVVEPGKGKRVTSAFLERMGLCLEEMAGMLRKKKQGAGSGEQGGKKGKGEGREQGAGSREQPGKRVTVAASFGSAAVKALGVVADKGLAFVEAGLLVARPCTLLEAGHVCVFDRQKGGPAEFAGVKGFEVTATKRFVVLYRPAPDESRVWKQPGKWVGTEDMGEARRWAESIAAGEDKHGVLPVPDPGVMAGLNQRQFLFCQYVLDGKTQAEAFTLAGYKAKDAYAGASEVAANPKVSQYLASKRAVVEKRFDMDRTDLLLWHKKVMDTPIGEIDQNHPLCQEYKVTSGENAQVQFKMPGKMDAAKEIKVIMGWDKTEEEKQKQDETVAAVATLLKGFMGGPK